MAGIEVHGNGHESFLVGPQNVAAAKRALSLAIFTIKAFDNKPVELSSPILSFPALGPRVSAAATETGRDYIKQTMEAAAAFTGHKRTSSFSLRCPSLNFLRLRRIFDLFDKNGDGMITIQEISQALNLLGLEADFSDLESTIKSHIKPDSVGLAFEDFVSLHQSLDDSFFGYDSIASEEEAANDTGDQARMRQEESDLSEAFKVFDEDGDGYISARELQVVLRKLGLPEAKEIDRIHQMITSVDRNQDGRVDFFEFKDMMRSVLVRSS